MESRIKKTIELHDKGYNCAQAVACAYCDLVGMDEQTALRATEAFGAGMGGMQATCGAVSGAVFLAGLKNADGVVEAPKSKAATYKLSKTIVEAFQKKHGTTVCCELKAKDPEYWEVVDKQNHIRLIRALEVCRQTGKTFTSFRLG